MKKTFEETVTGRKDLSLPEVFESPKKYSLKSLVKNRLDDCRPVNEFY